MRRARTVNEYVEWIRQALFEVQDLRECLEYEMEDLQRFPEFLEPLQQSVRDLYTSMEQGTYAYGREDLPFIAILRKHADQIPFGTLLESINETHRKGLDIDADPPPE